MSRVPVGYTGRILRVDLTREQIAEEYPSEDILRLHVGGVGLGAKLLYNEIPPGKEMGWDRISGRPLPETLKSLGLDYVIPDIW